MARDGIGRNPGEERSLDGIIVTVMKEPSKIRVVFWIGQ